MNQQPAVRHVASLWHIIINLEKPNGFDHRSGQSTDNKTGICCFSAYQKASRICGFGVRITWTSGETCLHLHCFSTDLSICKKCVGPVQNRYHDDLFNKLPDLSMKWLKIAPLALSNSFSIVVSFCKWPRQFYEIYWFLFWPVFEVVSSNVFCFYLNKIYM